MAELQRDVTRKRGLFALAVARVEGWGGEAVVDIDSSRVAVSAQIEFGPLPFCAASAGQNDGGEE